MHGHTSGSQKEPLPPQGWKGRSPVLHRNFAGQIIPANDKLLLRARTQPIEHVRPDSQDLKKQETSLAGMKQKGT
jgi:hypothetical protein